jgi:cytoskeletal protein RodZ
MAHHIPPTAAGSDDRSVPPVSEDDRALFVEFLLSARRRSGRSLDEISGSTKVPPRYLEALEQGRVELLPRGLYRRAIVRNYAAAVGLDPAVAIERFSQIFGAEAVLLEWQGVPGIPTTPHEASALRQAMALAPVTGMKLTSFRSAIPAQALLALPKIRQQLGLLALAAVMSVAVAITTLFIIDATRTSQRRVTPILATDVQTATTRATGDAAPRYTVAPMTTNITGASPNEMRITRAAADAPLTAGAISTTLRDADGLRAQPRRPDPTDTEMRLVITSQPAGARVTVNGIGWGVTPVAIRYLPPGDKIVRLTKDGYVGQERSVRLGENGGASAVRLTLRPRD